MTERVEHPSPVIRVVISIVIHVVIYLVIQVVIHAPSYLVPCDFPPCDS